ncbi:hypothetical protein MPNT_50166 [Candidatus Methylacidithermus pantelleriae]|uniref:Uncharacterized protein n=1 Tax=Candidatus Methylacidithermus pantelleriae TaxID=2744239 RepID=A0A8J2BKK3_9BACT|nr:hypothetical protein MPNT_50166 [Candidatus Methylacidithermus pantelleriae]
MYFNESFLLSALFPFSPDGFVGSIYTERTAWLYAHWHYNRFTETLSKARENF